MRCDALRCDAMRCAALQCDALRCAALRCAAMRWGGHLSRIVSNWCFVTLKNEQCALARTVALRACVPIHRRTARASCCAARDGAAASGFAGGGAVLLRVHARFVRSRGTADAGE